MSNVVSKICPQCGENFKIETWDRQLLDKLSPIINGQKFSIPDPKLCPLCRAQRRYIWRGELNLFHRKSALSGRELITFYPPEATCRVLDQKEYWSDNWNPLEFGRDFDFTRPFFEQFAELVKEVPLLGLSHQHNEENSEYTNCASYNKNCYLLAGANFNEDCYYGNYVNHCRSCLDNNFISKCELCYECVDCTGCYNLLYSQNSHTCRDSFFLHNCRNCANCFCCVNLVGKEYCYYNQQLTKDEYLSKIEKENLKSRSHITLTRNKFDIHKLKFPNRFMLGEMNENISGNAINNSRNAFDCFDVSHLWDCRYCHWLHQSKDCMDIIAWGFPAELCYECVEAGDGANQVIFSVSSYGSHNVAYCYYAMYSKNCFGSVSMRRNEYCILNKQYAPSDYERLVAKIISHMQETGEWGEFFPMSISPLCYNTSIAQDYFPLDEQSALVLKLKWHAFDQSNSAQRSLTVKPPDSIDDLTDEIARKIFLCSVSNKPFKLIKQEIAFYRKNGIPIPEKSFFVRHRERLAKRNPRQIWDRKCDNCSCEIKTSYPPYRQGIVYCNECYLKSIY